MGYGDFKLFAALLAWLGYQMFLPILLLSALTGAVTGLCLMALGRHGRKEPLPFGPFLAAAGFVAMVWGESLMVAIPFLRVFA
jgi:leader peptidase (prepilin peptidase)/N-methyltransferase